MLNPFRWDYGETNSVKELEGLLTMTERTPDGNSNGMSNVSKKIKPVKIWIWRITSAFTGLFFLLAAIVQHNDPDPYIWMVAYIIPCLVSWIFAFTKLMIGESSIKDDGDESLAVATLRKSSSSSSSSSLFRRANVKTYLTSQNLLEILITCHIIYCFALGIWTLTWFVMTESYFAENHNNSNDWKSIQVTHRNNVVTMKSEEAKELLGLCIVITWLSLLRNHNFIHLGQTGIYLAILLTITPFLAWILVEIYEKENDGTC